MSGATFSLSAIHGNSYLAQNEDYNFNFVYSTSSSAGDMALVKKISIHFPPYSTYDMTFAGIQCMEHASSAIDVKDCYIDTNTYIMWITPLEKGSYINSHSLIVETKGLAIINPINSASINLNQFVFKFYTWSGSTQPVLNPAPDDYVFFKQDSTYISSSAISYSVSYIDKHTSVELPREAYVNEFEPCSGDLGTDRMKNPFEFTFIAMANFNLQTGSNYHEIKVKYDSYYTIPTLNQKTNDLYYYVPTCHLNGQRI